MGSVYEVVIRKSAQKELDKLSRSNFDRVYQSILALSTNPRPSGCKKLSSGEYRIRKGDFRIIYSIQDSKLIIKVLEVKNRKDAYRPF